MMTVRPASAIGAHGHGAHAPMDHAPQAGMSMDSAKPPWPPVPVMALLSFLALAASVAIAFLSGPM